MKFQTHSYLFSTTFLRFTIFLVVFCKTKAVLKLPPNVSIPAVFVFGDSIMDTGNNNNMSTPSRCNYPPYGRDFKGGIPTGRFSNGKVPSDFIGNISFILFFLMFFIYESKRQELNRNILLK